MNDRPTIDGEKFLEMENCSDWPAMSFQWKVKVFSYLLYN